VVWRTGSTMGASNQRRGD